MLRRHVPFRHRILFFTLVCVLCLVALEFGVRVLDPEMPGVEAGYRWLVGTHLVDMTKDEFVARQERIRAVRAELQMERGRHHPVFGFSYNPTFAIDEPDLEVHVNEFALRGPAIPIPKPPGELRIVCLGGSTTAGEEVGETETYPAQLETILHARYPERAIRVINAGVPTYDTPRSLLHYQLRLWRLEPDVVTIYHGINDLFRHTRDRIDIEPSLNYSGRFVAPHVFQGDAPPDALGRDLRAVAKHSRVLRRLWWQFRPRVQELTQRVTEPDPDGILAHEAYYDALMRHIAATKAVPVPVTFALAWPGDFSAADRKRIGASLDIWIQSQGISRDVARTIIDVQNDTLRSLARAHDVPLCDAAPVIPPDRDHFIDVCHLTAAGNGAIATRLADTLAPLIERTRTSAEPSAALPTERN